MALLLSLGWWLARARQEFGLQPKAADVRAAGI